MIIPLNVTKSLNSGNMPDARDDSIANAIRLSIFYNFEIGF